METPQVKYAWNGDVALAYQVVGDGPIDLVWVSGFEAHLDMRWENPDLASFLRRLAARTRLIITDRRGFGLSDRFAPHDIPPLETLADDLLAVMDAAGSERAAILAAWQGGFMGTVLAATHPERVAALILLGAFPTYSATEETPWLPTESDWASGAERMRADWGTDRWFYRSPARMSPAMKPWYVRAGRATVAPGALAAETLKHLNTDVRRVLPTIQVPTLALSDVDGTSTGSPENARFFVSRIPGARMVLFQGGDQLVWEKGAAEVVDAITEFLASIRAEQASFDRVLATVLFTDIVGSTETAARLGDRAWRELVERHHATVRTLLARYRGAEVDTAGDGFFATFDGPARAVRCAEMIADAVRPLGIEVRVGVHTGEVDTIAGKTGGIAVAVGARVGAKARASEVLVSSTVKDLTAGSGLTFEDAGEHELKGVPDTWHLYRVVSEGS